MDAFITHKIKKHIALNKLHKSQCCFFLMLVASSVKLEGKIKGSKLVVEKWVFVFCFVVHSTLLQNPT